jgi:hypothetical protein
MSRKTISSSAFFTIVLAFSVALNVYLARRVDTQRAYISYLKSSKPEIGAVVPPLDVTDMSGAARRVDYPESGPTTVIYIFSPDCPWCARNLGNLRAVATSVHGRFRLIGVSLKEDGLRDYLAASKLPFEIYHSPTKASLSLYKLGGTPETWVIGPGGKILQRWTGAWRGDDQTEVESYFGVKLPGFSSAQVSAHGA